MNQVSEMTQNIQRVSGLKLHDAWKIFNDAINQLVVLAEQTLIELSGPEKKAEVLAALALFYDRVIGPIDLPYIPNVIEPLLDSTAKAIMLDLADKTIDSTVKILKSLNVFK